uniref:F-box domain-containing protein n=1 Tax=Leersia perrieri TaxID=77586 RepID=A0A0D9X626_9ORYZ
MENNRGRVSGSVGRLLPQPVAFLSLSALFPAHQSNAATAAIKKNTTTSSPPNSSAHLLSIFPLHPPSLSFPSFSYHLVRSGHPQPREIRSTQNITWRDQERWGDGFMVLHVAISFVTMSLVINGEAVEKVKTAAMSSSSSPVLEADILLSLTPEILDDILAWLPFKEVFHTCCVSHESVPGLAVRFCEKYSPGVVTTVLTYCAAPQARFNVMRIRSLNLEFESSCSDVHRGIGLVFPAAESAIYDYGDLSDLRLRNCKLPPPPPPPALPFAGFPRLTKLDLCSVALDAGARDCRRAGSRRPAFG